MEHLFWIGLGVALGLLGMWWWRRAKGRFRLPTIGDLGRKAGAAALRREVMKLVHDPAVAERMIASERERHPEMNEAALLRKVIRRLKRDRRR